MHKYIDADAQKESVNELLESPWANDKTFVQWSIVIKEALRTVKDLCIDNMPAADVEPVSRWISVDERLPEYEGSYLVGTAKSGAFISHYYPQHKRFNGANGHITHWMNRPEPPKMDGGSE